MLPQASAHATVIAAIETASARPDSSIARVARTQATGSMRLDDTSPCRGTGVPPPRHPKLIHIGIQGASFSRSDRPEGKLVIDAPHLSDREGVNETLLDVLEVEGHGDALAAPSRGADASGAGITRCTRSRSVAADHGSAYDRPCDREHKARR